MLKKVVKTGVLAALVAFSASSFSAPVTYLAATDSVIKGSFTADSVTGALDTSGLSFSPSLTVFSSWLPYQKFVSDALKDSAVFNNYYLPWAAWWTGPRLSSPDGTTDLYMAIAEVGPDSRNVIIQASINVGTPAFTDLPDIFNKFDRQISAVPVPTAAFMFAPALLGFAALRRKKSA